MAAAASAKRSPASSARWQPLRPTWTDLDVRAVDTVPTILAADSVQKVGNGHPGTAISLAPVAYLLYQNVGATTRAIRPGWVVTGSSLSCGTPA